MSWPSDSWGSSYINSGTEEGKSTSSSRGDLLRPSDRWVAENSDEHVLELVCWDCEEFYPYEWVDTDEWFEYCPICNSPDISVIAVRKEDSEFHSSKEAEG